MIRQFGFGDFPLLLAGLQWTLILSGFGFVGGALGGLLVALARASERPWLVGASGLFVGIFQGTPLLVQLFVVYFGASFLNLGIEPWLAVALGLTLHASAYLGEIWKGGIEAVPRGQSHACKALGMGYFTRMREIILPQAFKISLPATVGFLVTLIKGTALAAIIGFTELTRAAQLIANVTFQPVAVYGTIGVIYFLICWPLTRYSLRLERRFGAPRRA